MQYSGSISHKRGASYNSGRSPPSSDSTHTVDPSRTVVNPAYIFQGHSLKLKLKGS